LKASLGQPVPPFDSERVPHALEEARRRRPECCSRSSGSHRARERSGKRVQAPDRSDGPRRSRSNRQRRFALQLRIVSAAKRADRASRSDAPSVRSRASSAEHVEPTPCAPRARDLRSSIFDQAHAAGSTSPRRTSLRVAKKQRRITRSRARESTTLRAALKKSPREAHHQRLGLSVAVCAVATTRSVASCAQASSAAYRFSLGAASMPSLGEASRVEPRPVSAAIVLERSLSLPRGRARLNP